ncbi:MAG TPA: ABC transporter permease [Nakamurella sp.]
MITRNDPAVRRSAPPSWPTVALARAALEVRVYFRSRDEMIFGFLYPTAMMLIFGSVFGGQEVAPGVTYPQYFLAGIAATGVMLTSFQAVGVGIAVERDAGDLARLRTTPMPPVAYFLGKAGLVLVTTIAQLALLLTVAHLVYDIPLPNGSGWLTFAWVTVLGATAGTATGIWVSSLPRSGKSAGTVIPAIAVVLQFISGVFFVFSALPDWMQKVAAVFPLKWLTQGMRSVFLPESAAAAEVSGSWQHGLIALVLLAWIVGATLLALKTFRWRKAS